MNSWRSRAAWFILRADAFFSGFLPALASSAFFLLNSTSRFAPAARLSSSLNRLSCAFSYALSRLKAALARSRASASPSSRVAGWCGRGWRMPSSRVAGWCGRGWRMAGWRGRASSSGSIRFHPGALKSFVNPFHSLRHSPRAPVDAYLRSSHGMSGYSYS